MTDAATKRAFAQVRGVTWLFIGILLLWVGELVAHAAGVPDAPVDVAGTGIFALVAVGCALAARADIAPLLRRTGGWRAPLLAFFALGIMFAVGTAYFSAVRWLGFPVVEMTTPYRQVGWSPAVMYILVAVCPAIFEELTFRGYVMARLDGLLTPVETLLVQAALFALIHLGVVIFPSHFGIGVLLGVLRRRTGSLYPGMAVHMTWNAVIVWTELSGVQFP